MQAALNVLAVIGFAAVLLRLLRAGGRMLRGGIERHAAAEVARTRARRGDVTGMAEAQQHARRVRTGTWRAAAHVTLWLLTLAMPVLTPWTRPLYAAYGAVAVGWLVRRVRGTGRSGETGLGGE